MRKQIPLITAITLVLLGIAIMVASNTLRQSEQDIAAWLEQQTPRGSSHAEVLAHVEKMGWYDYQFQGSDDHTRSPYIRGHLGDYRTIFVTSVTVFWEFDSETRLESIRVWKTVDAL